MIKLFKDILTNPEKGKYSRKSVYALVTLLSAIIISILGLYRIGVDTSLVVEIVTIFLGTFLMLMGFSVWDKKK